MTARLPVALAGLGRMGRIHAANLARGSAVRLAAVHDADPEVARSVGEELDVPWVATFDDLIDAAPAVAISTPTGTHAELIVAAAEAGKHVFCEKPISLDRATAVAAVEAAEKAGVVLQVGFHRRFDPDWVVAAERIHAGELGEVTLFRTTLRDMNPPNPAFLAHSGGFFADVTVHDLDVARWLVGEVVEVTAHGAASDPAFAEIGDIDTAVVVLRFANGALGVIDNSRSARYGYECSTEVMGTLATARVDGAHRHNYEWRTPGWASRDLLSNFGERHRLAYIAELEAFAHSVGSGEPAKVDGRAALAAFDLAAAAERSYRTGLPVTVDGRNGLS
ncbi:Gfo/Idh/MocA family protein [Pseudonocardia sp. TRM90224]|uniref:Gfo/Idh/MocA family protein n=1 Tax=Pseudonocardia sp. TRM90224 TaxID=2812678 RepID=UPI001E36B04D|nr:Gfo/Idh/MocA family oxidoreductase [Pseudonocardia sp. TRM90224]